MKDPDLESEADEAKEEAAAALENYLELATQDWEERSEDDDEEAEDE